VPGIVDVAPPLFIGRDGEVIEFGNDLVNAAPEGECIEGIAMDFEDDDDDDKSDIKKNKNKDKDKETDVIFEWKN